MANKESNSQIPTAKAEKARLDARSSAAQRDRAFTTARNARGSAAAVNPPLARVGRRVGIVLNRIAAFIIYPFGGGFVRRADRLAETSRERRFESRVAWAEAGHDITKAKIAQQEYVNDNTSAERIAADLVVQQMDRAQARSEAIANRPAPILEPSFERPSPS